MKRAVSNVFGIGDWGYPNTDALGLLEYLYWCEDMSLTPVLGVWAGLAINSGGETPFTGAALQPYLDDVMHELEVKIWDQARMHNG